MLPTFKLYALKPKEKKVANQKKEALQGFLAFAFRRLSAFKKWNKLECFLRSRKGERVQAFF